MAGMRLPLTLAKKADRNTSPAVSVEGLINGYVSLVPDGKEPTPIFGTPGMVAWGDLQAGGIRGTLVMGLYLFVVSGSTLFVVDRDGFTTQIGDIGPVLGGEANVVSMAGDGANLVVVNDYTIYVYDGASFGVVSDPDAPVNPVAVEWIDNFFVFTCEGTDEFAISALADPTAYDALDFASAEWKSDPIVAPVVYKKVLYLFGATTIEAQQNVGDQAFPFVPFEGVLIDCGLKGRHAKVVTDETVYFLAHDLTARKLEGTSAPVISTQAINSIFAGWAEPESTVATSHIWEGHRMVVFRNPDGCVVYDATTGLWHERQSYEMDTWRVRCFADFAGMVIGGDAVTGALYYLDKDVFTEAGYILPFEVTTPWAYQRGKRFTINEVELLMETGVGTLTFDPQISCSRSKDGLTWALPKYRALGLRANTTKRITFGAQGQSRGCVFRFRITDPVRRVLLGAYAHGTVDDQ